MAIIEIKKYDVAYYAGAQNVAAYPLPGHNWFAR